MDGLAHAGTCPHVPMHVCVCVYGVGEHTDGCVHTIAAWVSSECTLTPAGVEGV